MRHYFVYTVVRIALFFAVWGLLTFTGIHWLFTGILAAVIAMLISILALSGMRQSVAIDLEESAKERAKKREGKKTRSALDAEAEDTALDASEAANRG